LLQPDAVAGSDSINFRLQREGRPGFLARAWGRWWVKTLAILAALIAIAAGVFWFAFARDLPSVDKLRAYEPPLPTNVRGIDGNPIHSFARERRVQLSFDEYPNNLVHAFLAAEDKNFFSHHGLDFPGLVRAAFEGAVSGRTPRGTSTLTQQVVKNLLVGNEHSLSRKIKEGILAWRIEDTLTKQQILELYLNQIFLGRNAYGVEAASHAYFDKDLDQLSLAQSAYLAILPKGPSNYDPDRETDRALERRNWVLGQMLSDGFITAAQHDEAVAQPLGTVNRHQPTTYSPIGGYFIEEVRRELIDKFGETDKDGPYSVYSGGLWVRTSFDPTLQGDAETALRNGLVRFDGGRGWTGPIRHVDLGQDPRSALLGTNIALSYKDWMAAIVTAKDADSATLQFADGHTGTLPRGLAETPVRGVGVPAFGRIEPGDIIAVSPLGGSYTLRSIPKISGAFVVEDPITGRVLAMQGGFDSRIDTFNRATQADRQPGSTIKPVVYSAALESGMTPASIIVDGPFCVYQGAALGQKCFKNFGNEASGGPHTMRWGIEQSRNLMTVRAAAQTGMDHVVDMIQRLGVSTQKLPPYLAYALGAGETRVIRMVNAYGVIVNQGRWHAPTLIDYVQNRHGEVIWPENWRPCDGCNAADWNGQPMPRPVIHTRQAVDPLTAYQMVHITEGVIQRGTAVGLRDLDRPMMGKTGTTSGPTDVWFVGGTPQIIGGLYLGYDHPVSLGGYAQGGTLAVPIYHEFAEKAFADLPKIPFRAPAGIRMVRIDRASGKPVAGAWPTDDPKAAVIWEAFKPESEPRRAPRSETAAALAADRPKAAPKAAKRQSDSDFLQSHGGIY
jgi:penicillin-binding protein 1A